ncbi:MAG: hypothetical protein COB66_06300 [Coxiella sp. (in: Bacteria)]|nr:MAG: hypothetical protein COB66_06300 [Coxiella sp. (in: g-proteobacteria)]
MKFNLRWKFTFYICLLLLAVGVGISLYSIYQQRRILFQEMITNNTTNAHVLAKALVNAVYNLDVNQIDQLLEAAKENKNLSAIYMFDSKGVVLTDGTEENILMGMNVPPIASLIKSVEADKRAQILNNDQFVYIAMPVMTPDQKVIGVLAYKVSKILLNIQLYHVLRNTLLMLVLILVLGIIGMFFYAKNFTAPLIRMARQARLISKGEYKHRLTVYSHDEIGMLTNAINKMTENLETTTVSKEYAENIFESIANMLIVVKPDFTITDVNTTTLTTLGYKKYELLDVSIASLFNEIQATVDVNDQSTQINNIIENSLLQSIEKTFIKRDKTEITVLFSSATYNDPSGDTMGIICSAQDISELKQTRDQLIQSQKIESVGRLAAGIARDFNNSLEGIKGNAEFLKKSNLGNADQLKKIDVILNVTQQAAVLVRQLLGFSQKGQYERENIDVNKIINTVSTLLESADEKNIIIRRKLEDDLWAMSGDFSQINQAVMNVGINALDAMHRGGELSFTTRNLVLDKEFCKTHTKLRPGDYILIRITDTGVGISSDIIDQIFEPFVTTKEVGKGTGLGLSVVYGITRNHGGVVTVYSDGESGSTFSLYFPRSMNAGGNTEGIQHQPNDVTPSVLLPKEILIVDDEYYIRDIMANMLMERNKAVKLLFAGDGEEAVTLYKQNKDHVELIIMDVTMPKMNGLEAFELIRSIHSSVPILFISGYMESDEIIALRAQGRVDFIQKPFSENVLIEKANGVLH